MTRTVVVIPIKGPDTPLIGPTTWSIIALIGQTERARNDAPTTVQPIRKTGFPPVSAGAESAAGLIADSLSANTRRAYRGALARLDAAVEGGTLNDEALAAYIGTLETDGRSPARATVGTSFFLRRP